MVLTMLYLYFRILYINSNDVVLWCSFLLPRCQDKARPHAQTNSNTTPHASSPLPRHSHGTNMANPYLVQALYGPKPVAPGAENVKPAAANNAPAPQPSSRRDSAADVKPNIAQGASAPASRPSNPFGGRVGGVQFGNFSDAAVTASPPSNPFGRTPADGGKTVTFGSPPPPGPTPSLVPKSILKPTAPASSPAPGPPPFVKLEPSVQSTAFSNTTTLWLGKNSSGVNPASLSGAPASQPLSLLERLYGTQATVKKEQEYYIHNVRRNSDGAQGEVRCRRITDPSILTYPDKSDDAEEETEPWRPTGANMLTLGAAAAGSNSPSLASAPMQEPSFSKLAATFMAEPKLENGLSPTSMQAINGLQPSTLRSELTLAPERYLPPPGPFYDQFMLAQIFTIQFSHCTCWVCWNAVAKCERRLLCGKKCKVCDRQHLGTVSRPPWEPLVRTLLMDTSDLSHVVLHHKLVRR
jgi:hypothetical protein